MSRAIRACGDAVRAGWLARPTIVSEGQEAGLEMLAFGQLGSQARGRPQQGHRRASCRPDFVRLSRKLALLDAVNRAEAALACSDVVR